MLSQQLLIPKEDITRFCKKWDVVEFALFGSILRQDFSKKSDIDVLITFSNQKHPTLLELAQMQIELQETFGRPVDLVEKQSLKNPYRRSAILESAKVIYAA